MSELVRLSERSAPVPFAAGSGAADTPGVVEGVVLCGLSSANGRDYPADVLRRDAAKYEGAQVYIDHLDGRGRSRGVREWFGEIRNVRSRPDGRPEGDLHYPVEHQFAGEFASRAKQFPKSLGLSHVAMAKTKRVGGRDVVESIEQIESVDLVASPATVGSLFEDVTVRTTLREVLESAETALTGDARRRCRKVLAEADDGLLGDVMDAPMEPLGDDLAGADAIEGGIRSLSLAILDDDNLTTDEKLKKLRLVLQTGDKLNGTETKPEKSDPDPEPEAAEESRRLRAENDRLTRELAVTKLTGGRQLSEAQTKALLRCDDDAERRTLLESFAPPRQDAERPRGAQKMTAAELLGKQLVTESKAAATTPTYDPTTGRLVWTAASSN